MLSALLLSAIAFAEDEGNLDVSYRIALRPELYTNPDYNPATENDSLFQTQQSIRLIVDSSWTNVKMRAAFQDVRMWGTEQTQAASTDALAGLFEGYFELGNEDLFAYRTKSFQYVSFCLQKPTGISTVAHSME